jgi:hypothetical protein
VVRLLLHAKLPDHLGHRLPLGQPNLSLAELPDDLLRSELLPSWQFSPSLGLRHQRFSLRKWRRLRGAVTWLTPLARRVALCPVAGPGRAAGLC